MKKVLIYLSVCISIFSADIDNQSKVEEQRVEDLIYEKVKLDYQYNQRQNKADYILFDYVINREEDSYKADVYDTRVFDFLISKGANINSTNPDLLRELLKKTINPKIYEYLIEKGLKVDREIEDGYSLLIPFMINNYPEEYIVSLIDKGVEFLDDKGEELVFAISKGHSEGFIDKFYELTEEKEKIALTAINRVSYDNSEEEIAILKKVFRYLLKKGISFNDSEIFSKLINADIKDKEVFEILFEGGLDPNSKDKEYNNPILVQAVYADNYEVVELMLKKGAKTSAIVFEDNTILGYAKDKKMRNLLVQYGAK